MLYISALFAQARDEFAGGGGGGAVDRSDVYKTEGKNEAQSGPKTTSPITSTISARGRGSTNDAPSEIQGES